MKHQLLRFLLCHMLIGIGVGWAAVAVLLYADYSGLWGLISNSSIGAVALGLMLGGFAITFGSVGMGLAIFSLDYDHSQPGGGKRQLVRSWLAHIMRPPQELRPVPVRSGKPHRRIYR